jgi:uncharacterized alkaline shock family protein YloU
VVDVVRTATLGSYGVTGFAGGPLARLVRSLGFGQPGVVVRLQPTIEIELDLTVALGVPVAEVARQVDSAVRYAVHRALDREVGRLTIHIDGLDVEPGDALPATGASADDAGPSRIRPRDLADSGTDVA